MMRNEEVLTENIIVYNVDMDKLKQAYYNNDIEVINKYKYLIMLGLNEGELENFFKEDEIIDMYRKTVKDINGNVLFQPLFTR